MRKLGHNMEKKVSLWWDVNTFDRYIKASIVPRHLRWEVPPNDGLIDPDSVDEWFRFTFLLKRKQKKIRKIDQTIAKLKDQLETHKETAEFLTLTIQLNKDLIKKDKEVQLRKSKKYSRDINDFKNDQVFKWQSQIGSNDPISAYSTPEKVVRVHSYHTDLTPIHNIPKTSRQEDPRVELVEHKTRGETPSQQRHDERQKRSSNNTPYNTHGGDPHIGSGLLNRVGRSHIIGRSIEDHIITTGIDLTMGQGTQEAHLKHPTDNMRDVHLIIGLTTGLETQEEGNMKLRDSRREVLHHVSSWI